MAFFRAPFSPSSVFLSPNYGSKAVKSKDDNVVFFGGGCNKFRDSVVVYNISKNSYQKFSLNKENLNNFDYTDDFVEESQFCGLAAFDMVYLEKDDKILIYGGITGENGFSDTLYMLENYGDLKFVQTIGDKPSPRIGHTFTKISDSQIVLFGGVENKGRTRYEIIPKYLNDIYILHINEDYYRWERIIDTQNFEEPCPRESHSTILYENQLVVYGGMNGIKRLNDVWLLNTHSFKWTKANTSGTPAIARSMHTSTLVDDKMYVFGGFIHEKHNSKEWKCTNNIQCLDLSVMKWKTFSVTIRPNPRAGHATIEHYGRLYIWSGRDDSNFDEILPIKCHDDAWYFETKKPLRVTDVKATNREKDSFRLEWATSINALFYVVELKEQVEHKEKVSKPEPMIVDDDEIIIEEHPLNVVVAKTEKQETVANKKPKIIIHENILLTPPNTIDTESLFQDSSSEIYEIVNILPSNVNVTKNQFTPLTNIEQFDGTSDFVESESTDSEMETYLAATSRNKHIHRNCWCLVGIFKNNNCTIKNYNSHLLNRIAITSENIPNLIGSKQIALSAGKTYLVRVCALNSIGLSETSDVVKVKMKDNEPIYNLELVSCDDIYVLKWNSTLTNIEFLVSFETNAGSFAVTVYKGPDCQCNVPKHLLDKTRIFKEFTISIRAITLNGQIIHATELRCTI